jgi:hypothetical protein
MATTSIKSTKDASTLAGGASGTIIASDWNGFDQHHPVGNAGSGAYRFRSLIYFPISFTGWAGVTSASLVLTTSTAHNSWGTSTKSLNVARSLVPWTEDAGAENNWTQWVNNTYNNYGYHNTAGTDYDTSDMTTVSVSGTRPSTVTINVTEQVRSWLNGATNNGFILYLGTETSDSHYAEFYSREYATSSARPTLNIEYTTNTTPTAPTLNSPLSAAREDGGVTFNFTQNDADVNDYITGYQVDVASDSGFSNIVFTDTDTVANQQSTISAFYSGANGLTPLSTYYWRVKTKDKAGAWSPYSTNVTTNTFKINLSPSVPSGLGPTGGAVVTTLTPTFTGTTSDTNTGDRVASVRVRLYLTNGTSVWDSGDVTVAANGAFSVACGVTLTAATNYYWTASAKDTFGYSSSVSSSASFSTFAGGVTLATPNDDTSTGWVKTLTPTFTFTALSNISQYTLKVYDTGGALFTTVGPTSPTPATSISYVYASTALQWNSRYFWTITATVNGEALAESAQAMFHTNSKPVALALSPSDGAAVGTTDPTFTIQFSDTDLSYGLPDSPTSLEVEVSRVSDSEIMYTLSKTSGLDVTSNGLNKANSTVTAGAVGTTLTNDVQYRYRSRYKDNAGVSSNNTGDWSTYRIFKPTNPPTVASVVAIAADLTSGVVNKPNPTVQYSYTGSASKAQAQRRVVAKNGSGTVVYDSGFVVSSATSGSTPTVTIPFGYLVQGEQVKFEITARDTELVDSAIVSSTTYNTTWSPPGDVDGVSATSENGSVIVRWDAVVNALFYKYRIYRRDYGTTTWDDIADVSSISTTSYIDYESGIGKRYDYRVTQYSDNGGGNILESNPLTAIVATSSSSEDNWFIVPTNNYGLSIELYAQSENRSNPFQEEVFEPFGRTRKVVVRTARYGTEGSFEAFIPSDEVAEKLEKLNSVLSVNSPVWLKDPYGLVIKVYLGAPELSYQPVGHLVATINYIEVE